MRGSAWEAASWTSRSGTPASNAAVMNACRNVCGPMGLLIVARRAMRRTIRPPPCRSSRRPSAVRIMGPSVCSPMPRSNAPGAPGCAGILAVPCPRRLPLSDGRAVPSVHHSVVRKQRWLWCFLRLPFLNRRHDAERQMAKQGPRGRLGWPRGPCVAWVVQAVSAVRAGWRHAVCARSAGMVGRPSSRRL